MVEKARPRKPSAVMKCHVLCVIERKVCFHVSVGLHVSTEKVSVVARPEM